MDANAYLVEFERKNHVGKSEMSEIICIFAPIILILNNNTHATILPLHAATGRTHGARKRAEAEPEHGTPALTTTINHTVI